MTARDPREIGQHQLFSLELFRRAGRPKCRPPKAVPERRDSELFRDCYHKEIER